MTLQLAGTNRNGSPELSLSGGRSTALAWSPFGGGVARTGNITSLPGFNGERQDPLSGVTHLGNGYRAYSPALRRFTCPDSESPFGVGGVNPYVYCDHDPVNQTDPSGHGPITWLIRKAITLGARLGIKFAEESSMSALTTAGMVETGTELATQWATGISQSIARAKGDAAAARKLGWASLATGLAGGLGLAEGDIQQTVKRLRGSAKSYGLREGESKELSDMFGPEGRFRNIEDGVSDTMEQGGSAEDGRRGSPLRSRTAVQRSPADGNLVHNSEFSLSDRNGNVMRSSKGEGADAPDNFRSTAGHTNEHGNASGIRPGSVVGEDALAEMPEYIMLEINRPAGVRPAGASVFDMDELIVQSSGNGRYTPGEALLSNTLISWVSRRPPKLKFRPGGARYIYLPWK